MKTFTRKIKLIELSYNRNRYYALYSATTDFKKAMEIMDTITGPIEKNLKVFDQLVERLQKAKGDEVQQIDAELAKLAEQEVEITLAKLPMGDLEKLKLNEADLRALDIKEFIAKDEKDDTSNT